MKRNFKIIKYGTVGDPERDFELDRIFQPEL